MHGGALGLPKILRARDRLLFSFVFFLIEAAILMRVCVLACAK